MNHSDLVFHPLIIPSVVIPLTAILAGLSALATFIAGLLGLHLKAEGPKKLLELMLKPRMLAIALVTNLLIFAGVKGFFYVKNAPVTLWRINRIQNALAKPSTLDYSAPALEKSGGPTITGRGKLVLAWTKSVEGGSFRGAISGGAISGGAIPGGASVFIGTSKGFIHELDPKTGDEIRRFFVGTAVSAAPFVENGFLFAGEGQHDTHHARFYKFDLSTGRLASTFGTEGHIEGRAATSMVNSQPVAVIPSGKGGLVAVDTSTMTLLWQARVGHIDSSPLIAENKVFFGSGLEKENLGAAKGQAYAFDLATGKKLWQREIPGSSWMTPFTWRDRVCFVFGEVYFPSNLGGAYCFKMSDGTPDVAYNNGNPIVAEAVKVSADEFLFSDLKGKVCRVSLVDGRAKWCRETGTATFAFANPVFDRERNVIIYPTQKEGLKLLNPDTGAIIAEWQGENGAKAWEKNYAPALAVAGGWILVDMKGNVRKLIWQPASDESVDRQALRQ